MRKHLDFFRGSLEEKEHEEVAASFHHSWRGKRTRVHSSPGFSEEVAASGFVAPTGIELAPDGRMFVIEKQGLVWIVKDGVRFPQPFLDLRDEVHNAGDKGLTNIALHANFASNGWVYLLYSVDPVFGSPDEPSDAFTWGRLTRYTASGDVAMLASRLEILGRDADDGFPNCSGSRLPRSSMLVR